MVTTLYHVLAYQGTLHPDKEETLQLRFLPTMLYHKRWKKIM